MATQVDRGMLQDVEELMAMGLRYDSLVHHVQRRHIDRARESWARRWGPDAEGFEADQVKGGSERTIQRYMARVRKRWAEESEVERPERRKELRRRAEAIMTKAYLEGGQSLSTAVQCLRVLQKMDGLEAPQRVEHSGQVDIRAMSPQQRQERIEELWAIRQASGKVIDTPSPKKLPAPKKKRATKVKAKPKKAPVKLARKKRKT